MGSPSAIRIPTLVTARGEATRARIVQAAAELVAARGVTGTTLEEVMGASRTSKSQFYSHFANKDALIFAVVNIRSEPIEPPMRALQARTAGDLDVEPQTAAGLSPRSNVGSFVEISGEAPSSHFVQPCHHRA